MRRLRSYSWPGNIRELQSVLKQAVLRAHGYTLLSSFLPAFSSDAVHEPAALPASQPAPAPSVAIDVDAFVHEKLAEGTKELYAEVRNFVDRFVFTRVLEQTRGNFSAAAEVLGISRQTMRLKLRALGITVSHSVELDDDVTS
jgi:two-component system nitrogen regulation response regulator GlnG